jgi:hypothetical protein
VSTWSALARAVREAYEAGDRAKAMELEAIKQALEWSYSAGRLARLGTSRELPGRPFAEQDLRRPWMEVMRGVRKDEAMDTARFMSENMEPDLVPALTIARGGLTPEASATLIGLMSQGKYFPDFAKDIHNLAASGVDLLPHSSDELRWLMERGGLAHANIQNYLDAVDGLYTVGSKQRAAASDEIRSDVLDYFEPKDFMPVSRAIQEATLRALLRNPKLSLDEHIPIWRTEQYLSAAPGRRYGVLSYTQTPEFLSGYTGIDYDSLRPYSARVANIVTDVPSLVGGSQWGKAWAAENELQTFGDYAFPMREGPELERLRDLMP